MTTLVNPLAEAAPDAREPAPRLETLADKTIGLLDISKPGGSVFLDRLEQILFREHGVAKVVRMSKPTYTKPAPTEVLEGLRFVDGVIEALAD